MFNPSRKPHPKGALHLRFLTSQSQYPPASTLDNHTQLLKYLFYKTTKERAMIYSFTLSSVITRAVTQCTSRPFHALPFPSFLYYMASGWDLGACEHLRPNLVFAGLHSALFTTATAWMPPVSAGRPQLALETSSCLLLSFRSSVPFAVVSEGQSDDNVTCPIAVPALTPPPIHLLIQVPHMNRRGFASPSYLDHRSLHMHW